MNQFATPGMGSLMGHRIAAGLGQLVLFLAGFGFFAAWFVDEMRQFYGLMFGGADPVIRYWLLGAGIGLAALAWLWALVTSLSLLREARRRQMLPVQDGDVRRET